MKKTSNWLWPLALGSLWGLAELIGGGTFYQNNVPLASVWLSALALFLLAVARGVVSEPGSSTLAGSVAALFKLAYAAPFYCHLLGIFFLGLAFDIAATAFLKKEGFKPARAMLTGAVSAYGGYALFAVVITYVVRYSYWTAVGLPKVLNHIFVGGSLAAVASLALVPLGFRAGARSESALSLRPRQAVAAALAVTAVLWTAGAFIR